MLRRFKEIFCPNCKTYFDAQKHTECPKPMCKKPTTKKRKIKDEPKTK
jgi:hypothetical protein